MIYTCGASLVSRKVKINMICQVDRRGLGDHSLKSEIIIYRYFSSDVLKSSYLMPRPPWLLRLYVTL